MGELKKSDKANAFGITITEECKLIPPPGFYAVTVLQDGLYAKALLSIQPGNEPDGVVEFIVTEDVPIRANAVATLHFHKQIREGLTDYNNNNSLELLKNEIAELIY